MAEVDFAAAVVDLRKITDYLLAEKHPEGAAKARFFLGCGFNRAQPELLAAALRRHGADGETTESLTPFGLKLIVEGDLFCPDGRSRRIRSVWVREGEAAVRLVTAYPREASSADR